MMNLSKISNGKWSSIVVLMTAIAALTFAGCDMHNNDFGPNDNHNDNQPPPVPTGLSSVTMDHAVLLTWIPVRMERGSDDLAGYRLYRGFDNNAFDHIATVGASDSEYIDQNLQNGRTYYYAISSFDNNHNESALSSETVFDTPRPEGFDVRIYSYLDPNYSYLSGFDFRDQSRLPYSSPACDFFMEYDTTHTVQAFYLWLGHNGYRIQDMGYTDSFDDITFAPTTGWSQFDYIEAIDGHTYVILTVDNHYAKVRVTSRSYDPTFNIVFDWGYQVAEGNRELKVAPITANATNQQGVKVQ
jgi:hypothetical protein